MKALAILAMMGLAVTAFAVPTVTATLESSKAGQTVAGGTIIDWTVKVTVSTGDNDGLALFGCDLVQDAANPAKFDIPPGDPNSLGPIMMQFSRPLGISNPGEGGATSGYIGVQRGTAGQKNLVQLGGAQNTFGQAGTSMGTDFNVEPGVGQSGPQTVLRGSFAAPSTNGVYTFRLQNGIANVLNVMNPDPVPPAFWPVSSATVNLAGASFSFTVGPVGCKGDSNCDNIVTWRDIDFFVAAQNDNVSAWWAKFPPPGPSCPFANNDVNGDGMVTWRDISPFVAVMNMTCPHP